VVGGQWQGGRGGPPSGLLSVPSENGPESDPVVTFLTYFDEDEGLDREAVKRMRNYLALYSRTSSPPPSSCRTARTAAASSIRHPKSDSLFEL